MEPARLLEVLAFAADKHRRQRRKDGDASPYINHPIAVARVLAAEGDVTEEAVLSAAILHDTIEDTETTRDELVERFGATVAEIVTALTDDKSLPKERRKELQVEHAAAASRFAKLVKIADKICNVRDIAAAPPVDWSQERRLLYLSWSEQVVAGCRGVSPTLERIFDDAVAQARRVLAAEA